MAPVPVVQQAGHNASEPIGGRIRSKTTRTMKFREIIRRIEDDGSVLVAQRGSHCQYEHPTKPGKMTVAGRPGADVPTGTAMNILRQAGLRRSKG